MAEPVPSWRFVEALSEPRRRTVFDAVVDADAPLTRDDVAARCGISRELAAFHLDKLLEAGLLEADFARPVGRRGPGAGRPAKRYRPAAVELSVQIPPREYELAARILVAAARADADGSGGPPAAVVEAARSEGMRIGQQRRSRRTGVAATVDAVKDVLGSLGYQPREPCRGDSGDARLVAANCPFHALVEADRQLVCGLNVAFVDGILTGLGGAPSVRADLDPADDRCCVVVRTDGDPPSAPQSRGS